MPEQVAEALESFDVRNVEIRRMGLTNIKVYMGDARDLMDVTYLWPPLAKRELSP